MSMRAHYGRVALTVRGTPTRLSSRCMDVGAQG